MDADTSLAELQGLLSTRADRERQLERQSALLQELADRREAVVRAQQQADVAGSPGPRREPVSLLDRIAPESGPESGPEAGPARAALTEAVRRRDEVQDQLAALAGELRGSDGTLGERIDRALDRRESDLWASRPELGPDLDRAAAEVAATTAALATTERALVAAEAAERHLTAAEGRAASAADWSTWDTFFGGGALSTVMKYERLEQVTGPVQAATAALDVLRTELAELVVAAPVPLEISDLTRFLDVWLDNLFTDWSVDRRIRDLDGRIHRARLETQRSRHLLRAHRIRTVRRNADAVRAREELLLRG